ncbi:MAG: hypothetical protein ACLTE2_09890 [Eubacteriales bacterium]
MIVLDAPTLIESDYHRIVINHWGSGSCAGKAPNELYSATD